MEELLLKLIEQNARIIDLMESCVNKLDVLDDVKMTLDSIETTLSCMNTNGVEGELSAIRGAVESVSDELQWHKELSFASQLIDAVRSIESSR